MTERIETFVYKNKQRLRCGWTTGTCAALAAKGAAILLLSGQTPDRVSLMTPKGIPVTVTPEYAEVGVSEHAAPGVSEHAAADVSEHAAPGTSERAGIRFARCAVKKDAGDDPDVTDGLLIFAQAEFLNEASDEGLAGADGSGAGDAQEKSQVLIEGGEGIGRVTKRGLNQPVGAAAINEVPRRMIREAVAKILRECGETRSVRITISAPGGERIAKRTFNPTLGIVGGISILGTSGIVEPMSEEALVETIRAEMSVLAADKARCLIAVPGNLGAEFLRRSDPKVPLLPTVKCGNHPGRTIDLAVELGFSGLLFAGHLGKLVKLGNGMMNTHSSEGDGRMDTLISCALTAGGSLPLLRAVQSSNTTEEALDVMEEAGILGDTMKILLDRIDGFLARRAAGGLVTGAMIFSGTRGFLGQTSRAGELYQMAVQPRPLSRNAMAQGDPGGRSGRREETKWRGKSG